MRQESDYLLKKPKIDFSGKQIFTVKRTLSNLPNPLQNLRTSNK